MIVGHDRILLGQHFPWHSTIHYIIYIISEVFGLKDRRGFVSAFFLTILETYETASTCFSDEQKNKKEELLNDAISLYFCHL